jgi:hypothetical protein
VVGLFAVVGLILVGGVVLKSVSNHNAAFGAGCGGDTPDADDIGIHFFGDLQQARDPEIQGGVDDPLGCAYHLLCAAQRDRVTESRFRDTRGEAVSPALSADTWAGPSAYDTHGLKEQHTIGQDLDDPGLMSTWTEFEATWFTHAGDVIRGVDRVEHWRVDFVKEDGNWRVCGLRRVEGWSPTLNTQ